MRFPQSLFLVAALSAAFCLYGQEPAANSGVSAAAVKGSGQDPAAYERGGKTFATYCAGCHGVAGKGGPGAPDLIRSVLVLDDEKGILIGPVIREGRPDKGMPKLPLSEAQISDLVAWLHVARMLPGIAALIHMATLLPAMRKKAKRISTARANAAPAIPPPEIWQASRRNTIRFLCNRGGCSRAAVREAAITTQRLSRQ